MHRLINNTLISALETGISLIISMISYAILVYTFNLEVLGVYSFLTIFTLLGAIKLLDFGLEPYLINKIGSDDLDEIINGILGVYISSVGICFMFCKTIFLFYESQIPEHLSDMFVSSAEYILATLPIQYLNIYIGAFFQAREEFKHYKINNVLASCMVLAVSCICMTTKDVNFLSYIFLVVPIIRFAHYLMILKIHDDISLNITMIGRLLYLRSSMQSSLVLLRECRYLFFARITGFCFGQTDKLVIGVLLSMQDLGIYDLAKKLSTPLQALSSVMLSALLPRLSRLSISSALQSASNWITYFVTIISYFCILNVIVVLIGVGYIGYTDEYNVIDIFFLFTLIALLKARGSFISTIALPLDFHKLSSQIGLLGMLMNVLLSVTLAPKYGLSGVVVGTLISYMLMLICYAKGLRNKYPGLFKSSWKEISTLLIFYSLMSIHESSNLTLIYMIIFIVILSVINIKIMRRFLSEFRT